jgi:predicted phage tail protein
VTDITLHGVLGEAVGKSWRLAVKSVAEAVHAIEILSKRKLYKFLSDCDRRGVKFKVIINGETFESSRPLKPSDLEELKKSELMIQNPKLESIDIIPIIEGANSSTLSIVLGAILIVVGIILEVVFGIGTPLIIAGIGLVAAGVVNLLTSPPKFEDFRQIDQKGGQASYLFSGPQNTVNEGGPVPVGYGRLLVGSQVISASYEISHKNASDSALTS